MHNSLVTGVVIDEEQTLTLEEFCRALLAERAVVLQMIDYQFIHPLGQTQTEWRFNSVSLRRGRIAISFYRDLEVNMPGVALALELLDRIEELEQDLKSKY